MRGLQTDFLNNLAVSYNRMQFVCINSVTRIPDLLTSFQEEAIRHLERSHMYEIERHVWKLIF